MKRERLLIMLRVFILLALFFAIPALNIATTSEVLPTISAVDFSPALWVVLFLLLAAVGLQIPASGRRLRFLQRQYATEEALRLNSDAYQLMPSLALFGVWSESNKKVELFKKLVYLRLLPVLCLFAFSQVQVAMAQTCAITGLTGTASLCSGANSNTYNLSGQVTFSNAPTTGALVISVQGGHSVVFNAPFTSPKSFSIQKLVADGVSRNVTAYFTNTPTCTFTTTVAAPAPVGTGFFTFPLNSVLADAYYNKSPLRSGYVDEFYYPGGFGPEGLVGEAFDLDLQPAGTSNLAGFCVELWEPFGGTTHYYNKYTIVPLETISKGVAGVPGTTSVNIPSGGIGKVRAGMLRYLFDNFYVGTDVTGWTNNQAAAFQYAVWEISHESYASNNSFSISTVSSNGFYTTSTFYPSIVNLANSYLAAINTLNWTDEQWMSYQPVNYHVFAAEHDVNPNPAVEDYQDFLFAQPIACAFSCTPPSAIAFSQGAATCTGSTPDNNGTITLTAAADGTHFGVSTLNAAMYDGPTTIAGATAISLPHLIKNNIPNTGGTYIVRIFNGADGCYTDETVTVTAVSCPPAGGCSCTDYLYVNEIPANSGGGGEVHKFSINPANGTLTEILNNGNSWYPGGNPSELPNPHGLGVDINGYLYIGNSPVSPNAIRRLTCDGEIRPTSEFAITAAGYFLTNIGSYNGFIYSNGALNRIYKWDPCTGDLVGYVVLQDAPSEEDWGLYVSKTGVIYATHTSGGRIWVINATDADFTNNTAFAPAKNLALDPAFSGIYTGQGLGGIVTDDAGNIYVVNAYNNSSGSGLNSRMIKLSPYPAMTYLASTAIDGTTDGIGWNWMLGLAYSSSSGKIYSSSRNPAEPCIFSWNTDMTPAGPVVGVVASSADAHKGIAISTECCPNTTPQTFNETVCSKGNGEKIYLQKVFNCGDGILCEGMWTETMNNSGGAIVFNSCDLSITVNGEGCATFSLAKTTPKTGAQQCDPFEITLTVCTQVPFESGTVTPANSTCVSGVAQNNGSITLANFTTGERYRYSPGATFNAAAALPATITTIPVGGVIASNLSNTTQQYTVRIYNPTDDDCFVDRTVGITAVVCPFCINPTHNAPTTAAGTCTGGTPNSNATITVTGIANADRIGISTGATYSGTPAYAAATNLTGAAYTFTGLMHNTQYTIRIFNGDDACFTDVTITTADISCCTVTINTATPTACTPATNTYSLVVNVSWANASGTTLTVSTNAPGATSQTISTTAGSSGTQSVTFTGLTSNAAMYNVTAGFNAGCTVTTTNAFTAPPDCSACGTPGCGSTTFLKKN